MRHFEMYYENCLKRDLSPATVESYDRYLTKFKGFLDQVEFKGSEVDVTVREIEAYASWVNGQDYKPSMKHGCLQALLPFYREAVKNGWMADNPTENLRLPKKGETIPNVLSVAEVKKILAFPDISKPMGIRDRMLMELCYSTGIRACEASRLKVTNFFDDFTRVRFIGKGNQEAVLPVGRMASHFLKFYVKEIWPTKSRCEKLLISHPTGEEMKIYGVKGKLKRIGDQFGLKFTLSAHVFRYSIATHLSSSGADIRLIQAFLRHNSLDTTARYISYGIGELKGIHSRTHPQEVS